MNIGIAQLDIEWELKDVNKIKCCKFIDDAKIKGIDFLIFPEMSLTGFTMDVEKICETQNETISWFMQKSKENDMYIGFGYVGKLGNKGLNKFIIVNRSGEIIADYTKIHPFSHGGETKYYRSGNEIVWCEIDDFITTPFICYDLRFPEIFQVASKKSQLIVIIANWPETRRNHWITLLKARAIENQCYIVGANRVGDGNNLYYCGDSMIISPTGEVISKAGNNECLITAEINLKEVIQYRKNFRLKNDRNNKLYTSFYKD